MMKNSYNKESIRLTTSFSFLLMDFDFANPFNISSPDPFEVLPDVGMGSSPSTEPPPPPSSKTCLYQFPKGEFRIIRNRLGHIKLIKNSQRIHVARVPFANTGALEYLNKWVVSWTSERSYTTRKNLLDMKREFKTAIELMEKSISHGEDQEFLELCKDIYFRHDPTPYTVVMAWHEFFEFKIWDF